LVVTTREKASPGSSTEYDGSGTLEPADHAVTLITRGDSANLVLR
jgi:hypothetical protein